MQIIAQWVPGSWAGNSKCLTPIRAETVSRHNEVMTPGRMKMSLTGHIRVVLAILTVLCRKFLVCRFIVIYWHWSIVIRCRVDGTRPAGLSSSRWQVVPLLVVSASSTLSLHTWWAADSHWSIETLSSRLWGLGTPSKDSSRCQGWVETW